MSLYNNFWLTRIEDLAQNTSIEEYYLHFDALRGLVEYTDPFIPESHYTSLFINGLATEVHAYVEGFSPITVLDAYSLACIFVNGYSQFFPLSSTYVVVPDAEEVAEPIEPVESNFVPLLEDAEQPEDVDDYTVMVKDISVPFTVQHNDIGRLKTEASTAIRVPSFSATPIDSRSIGQSLFVDVDIRYDIVETRESANGCAIKNVMQAKWGLSKFCFDPGIFLLYPDLVYSSNHGLVEDSMGEVTYRSGIAQGSIMLSDICVDTRVFPCLLCVLNASDSCNIRNEFLGSCLRLCLTVKAKPVVECDYVPEQVVSYTIAASLNDINLEELEEVPVPHTDMLVAVLAQEDKGADYLLVLVVPWNGYIPISCCYHQVICIFIWSDTSFYQPDDGFYSLTVVQMHGTALLLPFRVQLLQWTYPKCLLIAVLKCSLSKPQESPQVLNAALARGIAWCNISCGVYGFCPTAIDYVSSSLVGTNIGRPLLEPQLQVEVAASRLLYNITASSVVSDSTWPELFTLAVKYTMCFDPGITDSSVTSTVHSGSSNQSTRRTDIATVFQQAQQSLAEAFKVVPGLGKCSLQSTAIINGSWYDLHVIYSLAKAQRYASQCTKVLPIFTRQTCTSCTGMISLFSFWKSCSQSLVQISFSSSYSIMQHNCLTWH